MSRNLRETGEGRGGSPFVHATDAEAGLQPGQQSGRTLSLPDAGFVRIRQILAVYPVGRSTWWAGVKSGRFPRPVKLGPRTTAWRVEDIRRLLM